ncbi:hypothetical protein ACJOMK_06485, partial [Mycoplasmopsis synoviae]
APKTITFPTAIVVFFHFSKNYKNALHINTTNTRTIAYTQWYLPIAPLINRFKKPGRSGRIDPLNHLKTKAKVI